MMTTMGSATPSQQPLTPRGRKPKSNVPRSTGQIKLPEPIHKAIAAQCESAGVHFTDVGAYFFLAGMNQARAQRGEPALDIPPYLEAAARTFQKGVPAQTALEYEYDSGAASKMAS